VLNKYISTTIFIVVLHVLSVLSVSLSTVKFANWIGCSFP